MKRATLSILKCPVCKGTLALEVFEGSQVEVIEGKLNCEFGHSYFIRKGIPNFIYPERLMPSDEEFQQKYNQGAEQYDKGMKWLFASFFEEEHVVRGQMIDLLEIEPGAKVLDAGCGTGGDALFIADRLETKGEIHALDISAGMIEVARRKLADSRVPIEYLLSNAAYLPFADGIFDAVLHFGGLNNFGEIKKALAELTRVVRNGGKVVVGDESVPPWLRETMFGKVLIKANPLYQHALPLEHLPENAQEVCVRWILGSAFYLIDYRVGDGPPKLDLDLPIPGKGDTLRSRYFGSETNNL